MKLTDREVAKLMKLQAEIDKEASGKCRGFMIQNRTRQIRLIFNNARRREKELDAKAKSQGVQLSLFEE
jgi:hypothetical protein